jgi:3-oxoadipate enol-lactonase
MPDIKTDDGCIIHVEVDGPPNAPVLMLSNSLGTNLHMWDDYLVWFRNYPGRVTPDIRIQCFIPGSGV